jgi:hypothetical protein
MYPDSTVLLVTYNLKGPSVRYGELYDYLKNQGSWWHYMPSTWLIDTNKTPNELFEGIRPLIQEDDHLIVVRITRDRAGRLPQRAWAWVKKHMGPRN